MQNDRNSNNIKYKIKKRNNKRDVINKIKQAKKEIRNRIRNCP